MHPITTFKFPEDIVIVEKVNAETPAQDQIESIFLTTIANERGEVGVIKEGLTMKKVGKYVLRGLAGGVAGLAYGTAIFLGGTFTFLIWTPATLIAIPGTAVGASIGICRAVVISSNILHEANESGLTGAVVGIPIGLAGEFLLKIPRSLIYQTLGKKGAANRAAARIYEPIQLKVSINFRVLLSRFSTSNCRDCI